MFDCGLKGSAIEDMVEGETAENDFEREASGNH